MIGLTAALTVGCEPQFTLPIEAAERGMLLSAWTDGEDVVAVGGQLDDSDALIVRRTEGAWCSEPGVADRPLWWIHGSEPGRWFGVGAQGLILFSEDGQISDESVDTEATLYGVWDTGSTVWAVGGEPWGNRLGQLWRRDAGVWSLVADELPGTLFKIWQDWIVGDGVAYRISSEGALEEHHPPDGAKLLTLRGRSDTDIWAVGGVQSPVLLHWDGAVWESVEVGPLCTHQPLNGIWTAPGADVWIAGMSGTMGRWDGEAWDCADLRKDDPLRDLSNASFHAVWPGEEGEMLWFGGNFFARGGNVFSVGRYGSPPESWDVVSCPH